MPINPLSKRELVSRGLAASQFTRVLELMPRSQTLMVLNYHRIGDASSSPIDSGVYSASADEFDDHIRHLKKRFHISTPDEALAIVGSKRPTRHTVFITFDDGYLDNYDIAFPILKAHGVSAMFFLATGFVGTGRMSWWDRISWTIKRSTQKRIRLTYPHPVEFDLDRLGAREACRRILRLYRGPSVTDPARFERELSAACGVEAAHEAPFQLFLNYDQAREMQAAGMAIGSHTHNHSILTTLTPDAQREEFRLSREILEREMKRPIDVLAYPVGSRTAFSGATIEGLKSTGYRAAFSHYGGFNRPGQTEPFDIRRQPIGDVSHSRFRLQTAIGAVTGSRWF